MLPRISDDLQGRYVTVQQMARIANIGETTVRKIAQECNATRKIGKSLRINREIFCDWIETQYSE